MKCHKPIHCFCLIIGLIFALELIPGQPPTIWAVMPPPVLRTKIRIIATGSMKGLYYPFARSLADILKQKYPVAHSYFFIQSTEGSLQNLALLATHKVDLALVQSDVIYNEIHSNHPFKLDLNAIRVVALLHPEYLYCVVSQKSGIHNFAGLEEKRLSLGTRDSGTYRFLSPIMTRLGLNSAIEPAYHNLNESIIKLLSGEIDGFFFIGGAKLPALEKLAVATKIKIISLPDTLLKELPAEFSYLAKGTIPAKNYSFSDSPTETLSVRAILLARKDLPDDIVRSIYHAVKNERERLFPWINNLDAVQWDIQSLTTGLPVHQAIKVKIEDHENTLKE